jgi:hypothetical protein
VAEEEEEEGEEEEEEEEQDEPEQQEEQEQQPEEGRSGRMSRGRRIVAIAVQHIVVPVVRVQHVWIMVGHLLETTVLVLRTIRREKAERD